MHPRSGSIRTPVAVPFFNEYEGPTGAKDWQTIHFGPHFGCAVDEKGVGWIWCKALRNQPFQVMEKDLVDMQCGEEIIYGLTRKGEVFK